MPPGVVCNRCFTSGVDVSIVVVGVLLVVNASRVSFVGVFSEGKAVFLIVSVVSFGVTLEEVPAGSAIKGTGHLVTP